MNRSDVEQQFYEFLCSEGLAPADATPILGDGKRRRFRVEGDSSGRKNGWYILYADDRPNGVAGSWRFPGKRTWSFRGERSTVTPEDRARWKAKREAEAAKQAAVAERAAKHSASVWAKAPKASPDNAYAAKKQINPIGARQIDRALVVPVRNSEGRITSLQLIAPTGEKLFVPGGRVEGCYASVYSGPTPAPDAPLLICEGYATACTLFEITRFPVVVAFNAGNLRAVANVIRQKYPDRKLLICADDDRHTKTPIENPGVHFAKKAANATGSLLCAPSFTNPDSRGTDFNDLALEESPQRVLEIINAALAPPPPPERGPGEDPSQYPAPTEVLTEAEEQVDESGDPFMIMGSFEMKQSQIAGQLVSATDGRVLFDELRGKFYVFNKVWTPVTEGDVQRRIQRAFNERMSGGYSASLLSSTYKLFRLAVGRGKDDPLEWNDRGYIPVQNGLLNLDTLELEPFDRERKIDWILPYAYDPNADCPTFDILIDRLSSGDENTRKLLVTYLAAIIRCRFDLQKYLELVGSAGSGKSSYMRVAEMLVGKENVVSSNMRHLGTNRFETAGFYGKRLALFPDERDHVGEGTDTFKAITGGDGIRYEQKGMQQGENFTFTGLVIVACNSPMTFEDYSGAIPRRRMSVHIDYAITAKDRDPHFMEKLAAEMPGVLNRLLEITDAEIETVFLDPEGHRANSTLRSLLETNPVYDWFDQRVVIRKDFASYAGSLRRDGGRVLDTDKYLYANYVDWLESNGRRGAITLRKFIATLKELIRNQGLEVSHQRRTMHGIEWRGIKLRTDYDFNDPTPLSGVKID